MRSKSKPKAINKNTTFKKDMSPNKANMNPRKSTTAKQNTNFKQSAASKKIANTKQSASTKESNPKNPYAKEFIHLGREIKKAYSKLEKDLKTHANPKTLQKDNNQLFLLLGECHYLARQCWQKTHPKRK